MRRSASLFVFMLLIIFPVNAETIQWYTYEKGMAAADSLDKPVFMDFYDNDCPPCKAMEINTYPDPRVVSEMKDFIPIKVNVQVRVDIEKKYNVRYYPTMVFLDHGGNEISRHIGYLGPEDMVKTINETHGKLPRETPGFGFFYLLLTVSILVIGKRINR